MRPMADHDIIIMGGGISGSMAAIAAGRLGAKVLLIEQRPEALSEFRLEDGGELLEQVLQCDQTGDPAVLVHDDGKRLLARAETVEQIHTVST